LPTELDRAVKLSVQDAIRRDIIVGTLQPGTRITEASLSATHGVSRVPVREALRALEAEGFVESRANVGSRVAAIPVDDADDLFAVRETVEVSIARRAAARAASLFTADSPPPDEWWRIRRILADILDEGDAAVTADDLDRLPALNNRFHLGIADLSGSSSLGVLLRQLSGKIEWRPSTPAMSSRPAPSWSGTSDSPESVTSAARSWRHRRRNPPSTPRSHTTPSPDGSTSSLPRALPSSTSTAPSSTPARLSPTRR
jgi:DNA-binding GntR family transcriptional regulator